MGHQRGAREQRLLFFLSFQSPPLERLALIGLTPHFPSQPALGELLPPSTSDGKTTKENKQRKGLGRWPLQKKSQGSGTNGAKTNI